MGSGISFRCGQADVSQDDIQNTLPPQGQIQPTPTRSTQPPPPAPPEMVQQSTQTTPPSQPQQAPPPPIQSQEPQAVVGAHSRIYDAQPLSKSIVQEPPQKSNILKSLILSRQQQKMETLSEFTIPAVITKTLMTLGPMKQDPKLVQLFSDCEVLPPTKLDNGNIYSGQWSHGILNGFGSLLYQDQSFYEGWWINNERHFEGRFIDPDGDCYSGQWFADEMFGNGKFLKFGQSVTTYQINQDITEKAKILRDKYKDTPNIIYNDGRKYIGDMKSNLRNGFGILQWPDGAEYYGSFVDDKQEGMGIMHRIDGAKYEGQWFNNKMYGLGTFTWPNGDLFIEGLYENDQKEGYGLFVWADTHKYRGQFKQNQMTGLGRMVSAKGKIIEAQWDNGRRVKEGNNLKSQSDYIGSSEVKPSEITSEKRKSEPKEQIQEQN